MRERTWMGDRIIWSAAMEDRSELPSGLTFNPVTRSLSGIPAAGVYNIIMMATDGFGGDFNQTITLRVNSQPAANLQDLQVALPGIRQKFTWGLPLDAMLDADGESITFSLIRTNPEFLVPSWLSFNGTTLSGTPTTNNHQLIKLLLH